MLTDSYDDMIDCVGQMYVINCPWIMDALWSIAKLFILPETLEKIHLYGKTGWQQVLLDAIGPDQLPVEYGGTCQCSSSTSLSSSSTSSSMYEGGNGDNGMAAHGCVPVHAIPDDVLRRLQEQRAARLQPTSPLSPSPTAAASSSSSSIMSNHNSHGIPQSRSSTSISLSSNSTRRDLSSYDEA
jgi:hypothetical protein